LRPERIQVEVADEFQEIGLLLHHDGLVPVLEQVAHPSMAAVEGPRVAGEQGAHTARERPLPRPDEEVRMGGEERPRVDREAGRVDQGHQPADEVCPVQVGAEDRPALESSHHHVLEDPGSIEARLAGHLE